MPLPCRERGETAFERLLGWYKQTDFSRGTDQYYSRITAVKDTKLAERLTSYFTTKLIKPQDLFYWFIYLMRNRYGREITWQWMITNWDWIIQQYKGDHDYADFPKYAASLYEYAQTARDVSTILRAKAQRKQISLWLSVKA